MGIYPMEPHGFVPYRCTKGSKQRCIYMLIMFKELIILALLCWYNTITINRLYMIDAYAHHCGQTRYT